MKPPRVREKPCPECGGTMEIEGETEMVEKPVYWWQCTSCEHSEAYEAQLPENYDDPDMIPEDYEQMMDECIEESGGIYPQGLNPDWEG